MELIGYSRNQPINSIGKVYCFIGIFLLKKAALFFYTLCPIMIINPRGRERRAALSSPS
jgi:hypothetical protein